jgi:hypothetical protein
MPSDDEMRGTDLADDELPDDVVAGWLGIDPSDLPAWRAQDRARRAERAAAEQAVRDANWPGVLAAIDRYETLHRIHSLREQISDEYRGDNFDTVHRLDRGERLLLDIPEARLGHTKGAEHRDVPAASAAREPASTRR